MSRNNRSHVKHDILDWTVFKKSEEIRVLNGARLTAIFLTGFDDI